MEEKNGFSRPSWDEYFMLSAVMTATRSACLKLNAGAVIVKNKRIISSGYNGPAPGIPSPFELGYCRKEKANVDWSSKSSGHCLSTHAEANAIIQNHEKDLTGATMYSLYFPCNECAKLIASSGIKELVFLKMYREEVPKAEEIFKQARVNFRQISLPNEKLLQKVSDVINSTKE